MVFSPSGRYSKRYAYSKNDLFDGTAIEYGIYSSVDLLTETRVLQHDFLVFMGLQRTELKRNYGSK